MMFSRIVDFTKRNPKVLIVIVLSALYLFGWYSNGSHGTRFDLPELRQFIMWTAQQNIFDIGGMP